MIPTITTNRPGQFPSRCRRLKGTIRNTGPYLMEIVLPKGNRQTIYFDNAQELLPFVLETLKRAGLDNRMVRLANGLLAIMKEAPIDDSVTVERLRRLIAAP